MAERAVALRFVPDGQAQKIATATRLQPAERRPLKFRVVVRDSTVRIADVSEWVREREQLDGPGDVDLASQDVLIEVVPKPEKQQWTLRVQLEERA